MSSGLEFFMNLAKLKVDFELFRDHAILIRRLYNTYVNLFFSGNDDVLIKTARQFFNDISEIMVRDWILQVSKLMDPAENKFRGCVNENISIRFIDVQLKKLGLLSPEIIFLSDRMLEYGSKLVPARNKRIAHFDRKSQIDGCDLGETTQIELFSFLENIQLYCDFVGGAIGAGPLDFSASPISGDEIDLLMTLRNCLGET
jgi:hypothetical protein